MDKIDKLLIQALQKNARSSLKELSKQINLSLPSTSERLRKLEKSGYINGYTVLLNKEKFKKNLTCFCLIVLKDHARTVKNFRHFVKQRPEIAECHCIAGEYEYLLKIVTDTTSSLEQLLQNYRDIFGVGKSYTCTVLLTIKEEPCVYL